MTSLERSLRAIRFQNPDRVPVIPQTHIWSLYQYGSSSEACMNNGDLYAELQLKALQDFRWDGVFVATDSVALAHSLGAPVEHTEIGVAPASRGLLEDLKDVATLRPPDLRETRLNEWVRATRLLVQEVGEQVLIIARADQGPFSLACQLRGMQDFMMEIGTREHPEDIHRLLRFSTEYVWQFAALLLDAGAHVVSIGDALASGSLIAPATFEEFAFPYQQEIARRVHQRGGLLSIHVCGQTTPVMSRLVATGADVLEFDAQTDFETACNAARGKSCLLGNVETSGVMTFGSPDAVVEECRWRLERIKPESGYILSSGCALSPNAPAENIHAMIRAANEFGEY
ncbi:MAG: uroporphyrinogen decarboxylase family protein [Bacteroidota bacterium]